MQPMQASQLDPLVGPTKAPESKTSGMHPAVKTPSKQKIQRLRGK
jgi:hypothetical protein